MQAAAEIGMRRGLLDRHKSECEEGDSEDISEEEEESIEPLSQWEMEAEAVDRIDMIPSDTFMGEAGVAVDEAGPSDVTLIARESERGYNDESSESGETKLRSRGQHKRC